MAERDGQALFDEDAVPIGGKARYFGAFTAPGQPNNSTLGQAGLRHEHVFVTSREFEAERERLSKDEKLSPLGRAEKLKDFALQVTLPKLRSVEAPLAAWETQ